MAVFTYEARTQEGKTLKGLVRAPDKAQAQQDLRRKNLNIVRIAEEKKLKDLFGKPLKAKAKAKEVAAMTRQLSTMIAAGLTLIESLETLYEQARDRGLRIALDDIIERVRAGSDLSSALAQHPKVFNTIYVNMVKAAEASGQLDTILIRLAEYLEATEELKRDIRGAVVYPVFSLALILLITGGLIVFIIPRFKNMFSELGMESLPWITEFLLWLGDFSQANIHWIILGMILLFIGFRMYIGTKVGQWQWHWFLLHLPVFGPLFQKVAISRFARTLSTLLESGVNMLGALEICAGVSGNRLIEETILYARDMVNRGKQLSEPLSESTIFPPIVVRMVAVGEKTGALEDLLGKLAGFYDIEVRAAVKALTSTLEPILIVTMGLIVGTIVLAIFLPIIELQQKLGG
jgi:type IV pilus assembly protein PilC